MFLNVLIHSVTFQSFSLVFFYFLIYMNSHVEMQAIRSSPSMNLLVKPLQLADNLFVPLSDYIRTPNAFYNISDIVQERAFGFLRNTTHRLYDVAKTQEFLEPELKEAIKNPAIRAEIVKQIMSIVGSAVKFPKENKLRSSVQQSSTTTSTTKATTTTTTTSVTMNPLPKSVPSNSIFSYTIAPSATPLFQRHNFLAHENPPERQYYQMDPFMPFPVFIPTPHATESFSNVNPSIQNKLFSSHDPITSKPSNVLMVPDTAIRSSRRPEPTSFDDHETNLLSSVRQSVPPTVTHTPNNPIQVENGFVKKKIYERPQLHLTSLAPLPVNGDTMTQALKLLSVNIANMFTKAPSINDMEKYSEYIQHLVSLHYPYTPHIFATMALNLMSFVNETNHLDIPPPSVFHPRKLAVLLFFRDSETAEAYASLASDYIRIASTLFTYKRLRKLLLKPQLGEGLPRGVPLLPNTYPSFSSLKKAIQKLLNDGHVSLLQEERKNTELKSEHIKQNNEVEGRETVSDIYDELSLIDRDVLMDILQLCEYYEAKGTDIYFTWFQDIENDEPDKVLTFNKTESLANIQVLTNHSSLSAVTS